MRNIGVAVAAIALVAAGSWLVPSARGSDTAARAAGPETAVREGAVLAGCPGCSSPKSSSGVIHADCDACSGWVACLTELEAAGASMQVVKLKNGVMYVFMVETPARVRVVQVALARRNERLKTLTAEGDRARLCPECRLMRGAAVSGKLAREVLNFEGGCLTVTTSSDPSVVEKIHFMAGFPAPVKS